MSLPAIVQALATLACAGLFAGALLWARREGHLFHFGMGALVWAVSVVCKIVMNATFGIVVYTIGGEDALRSPWATVYYGLSSALWELGTTAVFLYVVRRGRHTVRAMICFGLGAGAVEALMVAGFLSWALLASAHLAPLLSIGRFLERAVTLVGHVASRMLIYAGTLQPKRTWWAFVAAVLLFGGVDASADAERWDFESPAVYGVFLAIWGAVAALESLLAWLALRQARAPTPLRAISSA